VIGGLVGLGAAGVIAIVGVIWRRVRWPASVTVPIIAALAVPHLHLLLVEAYPTSFFTSPTEFAATAIAHGAKPYAANCVTCHGAEGHGDGPAAKSLPIHPADLTAQHLRVPSDGEMFWHLTHGFDAPEGGVAMPGFEGIVDRGAPGPGRLSARHNAGDSMPTTGVWSHSVPAPRFDATCADGHAVDPDDLPARVLRIIAVSGDEAAAQVPPAEAGITTILLARKHTAASDPAVCVASEPETWTAFAIPSGVPDDALAGEQVLVDRSLWLRARWQPGNPGGWINPKALAAVVAGIEARPPRAEDISITTDRGGSAGWNHRAQCSASQVAGRPSRNRANPRLRHCDPAHSTGPTTL
jgi:cytochrome c553